MEGLSEFPMQAHGASGWASDGQLVGQTLPVPSKPCQGAFQGAQWRIMRRVSFDYHEPTSVREAVELGARFGNDGRFLAGGTDLLVQIRRGQIVPRHLLSLHRVPGLDAIEMDGTITLGALVTHRQLERTSEFRGTLQALGEGAQVVGGHQIRNVATVGGNIVNASPAADVVPVLLALDAAVTLWSPDGERTLPLETFASAPGVTARRPGELLTHASFARPSPHSATAFLKAGRRRAMEISLVCVAVRVTLDARRERCLEARIALGAVAPTTLRARAAERSVQGRSLSDEVLAEAGRAAAGECQPISDVRASARYRALLVATLVPRALARCRERLQGAS
jgi:CO/xanthine dehydrogenase FAD-binding subunit